MIQPLEDRILIQPDPEETQTPGGIYLPVGEVPHQGTVVAVGPDVETLNPNDRVHYSRYAGSELKHHGETYQIMRASEVLALIVED